MTKIGFDNETYLQLQSKKILERVDRFGGKLYLMRRIPDRWELPRRCAAVPLIGLAAGLLLTAILICLCNLIYFKATPPQCIPAGEHFLFWRAFG